MPPFITVNGKTGYYYNGQFVPATQQEYDALFNSQQNQSNPYLPQSIFPQTNRTEYVTQGTIQSPQTAGLSNEQKVMQKQGNESTVINNQQTVDPYQNLNQNINSFVQNAFSQAQATRQTQQSPYTPTGNVIPQGPPQSELTSNPLVQGANNIIFQNPFINPTAPTQTQVTSPVAPTTPEIIPNPTADQSSGGNWLSNIFNKQSVKGVPNVTETATSAAEGTGDVLGDWGKLGFSGKEFFKSDAGQATSAIAGAGVGLVSNLVKAGAQDKYDPRVGMSKPNLGGNLFGDATFTQVGLNPALMAATGGISALVGGGVDLIKNAVKYAKQKDRYENKKLATDTMQSIDDARENMKPDYTGYARFGTQVNNPYIKKFNPGGETPMYSWGTGYIDSPIQSKAVSTISSSNSQTYPSITQTTAIPSININKKEKKSLPFIDDITGLNNIVNNDKSYLTIDEINDDMSYLTIDENILNNDIFKNVAIDNTYTGINPNMRKVPNAPYKDISIEANLNTAARDYLEEIYTSPGYKEKLKKELKKSGITDKSADDIITERLYRVQNVPMQALSKNDPSYKYVYGYMHPMNSGPFITSPSIRMRADRAYNEPRNYFSTAIEELEHAAHVKQNMLYNMFNNESNQNITPEAKRIFDLHAPATSKESTQFDDNRSLLKRLLTKPYLKQYTENMAKKRAAEAYLINRGLLKPGENVNEDHYNFLLDNYFDLPSNVKSALDMTNENEDVLKLLRGIDKDYLNMEQVHDNTMEYYKSKENPKKEDFKYYYNNQKKKEELLKTKQKYKKSQENFLQIMNGIAMNLNNPYMQTARFGLFIKPENRGKFTKWAQDKNMGVQEAANTVMDNKEEYQPEIVKMANFAKNSIKWK